MEIIFSSETTFPQTSLIFSISKAPSQEPQYVFSPQTKLYHFHLLVVIQGDDQDEKKRNFIFLFRFL